MKDEGCENGRSGFEFWLCSTCCRCSLMVVGAGPGGGGVCDTVLDEYYTWSMELVALVNMLQMLSYGR